MSLQLEEWWIFSKDKPPLRHEGALVPKYARDRLIPWAYCVPTEKWYRFNHKSSNWHFVVNYHVPPEYKAQLLLIR